MNPLEWKREHRIALLCAFVLGCFGGLFVGLHEISSSGHFRWVTLWCSAAGQCTYLLNGYWLSVTWWSIIGGLAAVAIVYIGQLLRA